MSTSDIARCGSCGSPLRADEDFCPNCGASRAAMVVPPPRQHHEQTESFDSGFFAEEEPVSARPYERSFNPEDIAEWLRGRLGPMAAKRTGPGLERFIQGVAGALLAIGTGLIASSLVGDDGKTGVAAFAMGFFLALGVGALATVPRQLLPAAVGFTTVAAPLFGLALFTTQDSATAGALCALLAFAILSALYFVGPSRGHNAHLGMLAFLFIFAGVVAAGADALESFNISGFTTSVGTILWIGGLAYLGIAYFLDRYSLKGMATAMYGVAIAALTNGFYIFVTTGADWAPFVYFVIGLAVLYVAVDRRRRGVLWFGVANIAVALFGAAIAISPDDDGELVAGVLLCVGAAALVAAVGPAARFIEKAKRPDPVS